MQVVCLYQSSVDNLIINQALARTVVMMMMILPKRIKCRFFTFIPVYYWIHLHYYRVWCGLIESSAWWL